MSRKDYEMIARILRETSAPDRVVARLAEAFGDDNPGFDQERFYQAVWGAR